MTWQIFLTFLLWRMCPHYNLSCGQIAPMVPVTNVRYDGDQVVGVFPQPTPKHVYLLLEIQQWHSPPDGPTLVTLCKMMMMIRMQMVIRKWPPWWLCFWLWYQFIELEWKLIQCQWPTCLWEEKQTNKQTRQHANLDETQDGWLTGWNCTGCLGELILQWLLWLPALSHATTTTTLLLVLVLNKHKHNKHKHATTTLLNKHWQSASVGNHLARNDNEVDA